jgi:hypothetical protein
LLTDLLPSRKLCLPRLEIKWKIKNYVYITKKYEDIKGQIGSNINLNSVDKEYLGIKGQIGSNISKFCW